LRVYPMPVSAPIVLVQAYESRQSIQRRALVEPSFFTIFPGLLHITAAAAVRAHSATVLFSVLVALAAAVRVVTAAPKEPMDWAGAAVGEAPDKPDGTAVMASVLFPIPAQP